MRVKLVIGAVITTALTAAAVWAGTVTALAAPIAARTVVYGFGGACPNGKWGKPLIKPAKAQFTASCEDGVARLHWTTWGRTSAKASGQHQFVAGAGTKHQAATILLSQVRVHGGRKYFSHLVIKWTAKGSKRHQEAYDWKHTNLGWMWIYASPGSGAWSSAAGWRRTALDVPSIPKRW